MGCAGSGTASFWKAGQGPGTPAALASPRCCPMVAPLTTAEPPPKRTSSNARASHTRAENPDGCDTPTASPWMSDTSMSCHYQTAAFASTTKPGFPTRATNCVRKSSRPKTETGKMLAEGRGYHGPLSCPCSPECLEWGPLGDSYAAECYRPS